ncbi:tripartite motif-containing protein 60-like [Anarhichas minor]|uniref:tripartite motif-containing protein 60-like n=1 Tax=Anarhichas minor TaxID=65739 RepID=UPI003F73B6BB
MASASSLSCDEQLLCSICLNVFTEPVSTPCGHNYCKTCITGYWACSVQTQCPLCMKKFRRRPQLQVNTGFRDMVENFKDMRVREEDGILVKPGEVSCDICLVPKLKAQKTCLGCLASYCQLHLEPHQRVATLKKHKLMDPVSNLEDRVCKKHDKMLELFCRKDQMCVCFMCWKDDHATHEAVPLEQAFRERKVQLDCVTSEMKMKENIKSRSINEIKYCVTQLEQEVAELRRRRSQMEQLLQAEDHLLVLQSWPSLHLPAHTEDLINLQSDSNPPCMSDPHDLSQQSYVAIVKKAVAQMEKTVSNEMEMLIHEVRLSDAAGEQMPDGFVKEVWTPPRDKLMMIQQYDEVDVTLDANTGHHKLMVSEDGKELRFSEGHTVVGTRRFPLQPFILGKEGFSSGRFYYEVKVGGRVSWILGVAKESINRERLNLNPEQGCWTLSGWFDSEFQCYISDTVMTAPMQSPQTVGVFVDYEKGEVSFYDVEARTLIYSYSGCVFIETISACKAFLYYMTGTSFNSRPKLYPYFCIRTGDLDIPLVITPVAHPT